MEARARVHASASWVAYTHAYRLMNSFIVGLTAADGRSGWVHPQGFEGKSHVFDLHTKERDHETCCGFCRSPHTDAVRRVDLAMVPAKHWPYALLGWTGSRTPSASASNLSHTPQAFEGYRGFIERS